MSTILREKTLPNGTKFQIAQGDITTETLDAIVNAANSELQHGGGVAWAIARRGGPKIQQESDEWVRKYGPVSHAEPAYTGGGELPCKYVIHAVGPIWGDGNEDAKLAAAVTGSLRRAEALKLASIAFPAISTGIYGFPKARAAGVIFGAIEAYFAENAQSSVKLVRLTLFDQPTIEAFLSKWTN
jgi:O-acetyl-ADP-ribose deacetylase